MGLIFCARDSSGKIKCLRPHFFSKIILLSHIEKILYSYLMIWRKKVVAYMKTLYRYKTNFVRQSQAFKNEVWMDLF